MPHDGRPLERLGFLTIGSFDPADPAAGHEETLRVIERAESLGMDSAWLRHRHLQHGISSPVALLAAASQRTSRIALGTAVTPIGAENPFRLAEDLGTVDVLLGGRLQPGFSSGTPMHFDLYREAIYPDTADREDFGDTRLLRFRDLVRGDAVTASTERRGIEEFATSVQPHSSGLVGRLWYGTGSRRSAVWAAEHGFHLLTSSVTRSEVGTDFATNQRAQVEAYLDAHPDPASARVSQGLVVIPTDSATPEQAARYRAYADARSGRVGVPQGPAGLLFAADLVGTSAEIADRLRADAGYQVATEVAFALPFSFGPDDYAQIIGDMAEHLGPALGWTPQRG
ncbi:alkanesulfonate monooxygenase SsuD/methylene tetrahydromethanopterin reductase-like flavin-dependent oxidoreductase (luciferase family) [Curtobacterium luteum]|uniref:Monooxygenase n=1 Tax=Curtobacterium luteum TaxID=33881 RepID=A0A8H9L1V8_9MICO|nr:LLM class flavin-dependent oxidoreductase [Curtobacterium luteum]MBM7804014.1 alkanesulfonate monooxygenase SsuD/methylene tetrahydromethanopterin reductase-like flavin-dependent oxidoreductase (luciferase family) [Curtobacterium luteum]NUU49340.1 LLM class flavin-dependent oxidoreductase [Curtobacterium luteum]GGK97036.1 monooxygenase [Curtobacterium luteum]